MIAVYPPMILWVIVGILTTIAFVFMMSAVIPVINQMNDSRRQRERGGR